jgi:hypothetical protein
MVHRCTNPKTRNYRNYGGRGIKVCERWLLSFADFIADMGPRPSTNLEIDRIDNDGNYEPGNVRWATRKQQTRNTRQTVLTEELVAELRQHTQSGGSVRSWAKAHGISEKTCGYAVNGKTWT